MEVYDDGVGGTLTKYFFAGGLYEVSDDGTIQNTTKYYTFAGQKVAMNDGGGVQYLITDHLSSTSMVLDAAGAMVSDQRECCKRGAYINARGSRLPRPICTSQNSQV